MSHDELEYTLSAKSYFLTGGDLSGSKFPRSIWETKTEGVISFLPALVLSPYFGLVPINQLTVRLPYVLLNLATAVALYFLVKKLFDNKNFAWLTSAIFLINPWSFYLSRVATDTAFCLLFFVLGILFCVDNSKKKFWLSMIFFVLGFLSYHGAKIIFLPLILVCLGYKLKNKKIKFKEGIFFGLIGFLVMMTYFGVGAKFFDNGVDQSRIKDFWILDKEMIAETVNIERKASIENSFGKLFSNKATVITKMFFKKYLTAFSPEILFVSGDNRSTYRFGDFGLFYLMDFFIIVFGLITLFKKEPKATYFLLFLILISPLATAMSSVETSIINRSFLLLIPLVILSAFGILSLFELVNKKISKKLALVLIFLVLVISFKNFLYFYFFRWPIIGQENYFFSQRVIANYIERSGEQKIVVIGNEPRELFLENIFYAKKDQNVKLKKIVERQNWDSERLSFVAECPVKMEGGVVYVIERNMEKCLSKNLKDIKTISEEQFGGPIVYIVNDGLCSEWKLQPWLRFRLTGNYLLEKMNNEDFCKTWIKSQ